MDFEIIPSGDYSFSFKALDNNDDIIAACIHSQSDQVYLEIIGYESEDPEGETVAYKDDAILLIRDIFEESQAADVPR